MNASAADPRPGRLAALTAGLAAAAPFLDALRLPPFEAGLSTFGRPPAFKVVLALIALGLLVMAWRAASRLDLARLLTLTLVGCGLFGQRAVPCTPGALLVLSGVTLGFSARWLRFTTAAVVADLALILALPALIGSANPQGAVDWCIRLVPHAALPWLLPSLFPGRLAGRPALVVLLATASLCLASLLDMLALSAGVGLPISSVLATRLRPLGLHPNLAVPQLVMSLAFGFALCWRLAARWRQAALLATLVLLVALLAVGSRTGLLTAGLAVGVLVAARSRLPGARLVRPLALAGVLVALLMPVTGFTDDTITDPDSRMVSKAVSFRSAMWELGQDAWKAAPWDGWGPDTTFMQSAVAKRGRYDGLPKDDHPHNIVLATGASLGWPGLVGLALLAWAGLRHRFGGSLLADGATAGLLATWAANGPDMGGAASTLYPALAFLGLAVGEAARQDDGDPVASAGPVRPLTLLFAVACVAVGLLRTGHEHAVLKASRLLDQHAEELDGRERALATLARVEAWAFLDPRLAQLRARAHGLPPDDVAAQLDALAELLERAPHSARAHHRLAQLRLQLDPDDTGADDLLERALRLDPWGPDAWRVRLDRSLVAATRGERERAFTAFVEALLLNPAAAGLVGWNPASRQLTLSVDGRRAESFALERVLAEIDRRRADLGEVDPPYGFRLRMREIEILQELDAWDEADAAARELLADADPRQIARRLAGSAARRGDWHEAIARLHEVGLHGSSWTEVDLLEALSHAEPLDRAAFDATWALFERDVGDLLFEPSVLRKALEARVRVEERSLDTEAASLWADRLAYANR